MPHYFYLLERARYHEQIQPALSASWRAGSFTPCRELCAALADEARRFQERYHVTDLVLFQVARGMAFDRHVWQLLVGEVLLVAACELPELQIAADALAVLLAPEYKDCDVSARRSLPPILQVHHGSRDLVFATALYRPQYAGYNDDSDVARLSCYLDALEPAQWTADALTATPPDERGEELAYARDWFEPLRELYRRARSQQLLIFCETV